MEPLGCNSPNGQHSAPDGQRSTQSYQDDSSGGRADKSAAVSLRACAGYDPLTIRKIGRAHV